MNYKIFKSEELPYLITYPAEYDISKENPVIIFLHGAGTRGGSFDKLISNQYFEITQKYENFPFVTVAPLCCENSWFDVLHLLKDLVRKIAGAEFSDRRKIYLLGNSMGGYMTWQLAMSMPEYFAAIVPICGGGMYWNAERLVNVPVWAFHGKKDCVVFPEESKKMVDAVNKCGGNAKLTVYPDAGHNSWGETYRNYEVFEWLLKNELKRTDKLVERFYDNKVYG